MKNQDQKKSTLIGIAAVIIVAVICGGGFLAWKYYSELEEKEGAETLEIETLKDETADLFPEVLTEEDWKSLLQTIETLIGSTFLDVRVGREPMSIWQTDDITGDGIPEAIVYLGEGGAYNSYLILIRIENDKPVIAQFKQKDGKISPLLFLAGGSVMNGEGVMMLSDKNAIYFGHWSKAVSGEPYGKLSNCSVEAYKWNLQTKMFDFNQSLSNEIRSNYCQKTDI